MSGTRDVSNAEKRAVEDRVRRGEYTVESPACATCSRLDFEPVAETDRFGLDYRVVACRHCGLLQVNPRLDARSMAHFYEHSYRKLYHGRRSTSVESLGPATERGRFAYDMLFDIRALGVGDRVVEIGCGSGAQLRAFRAAGCEVVGYDLDREFQKVGIEELGLDLRPGTAAHLRLDVERGDQRPDVVVMVHVLEHFNDPRAELGVLDDVLAEDGLLYVEVPGLRSVYRSKEQFVDQYYEIAHQFHFDLRTLTELLESCGWSLVAGDEHVHAVFRRAGEVSPERLVSTRTQLEYLGVAAIEHAAVTAADHSVDEARLDGLGRALRLAGAHPGQVEFLIGRRLAGEGDHDRACEHLNRATLLEPTRGRNWYAYGRSLSAIGDDSDALSALQRAVALLPDNPEVQFHVGNALQASGRFEEAIGAYAAAVRLRPSLSIAHYQRGLAYYRSGLHRSAIEAFEAAVSGDPGLAYAWHQRGLSHFALREFDEAVRCQRQAYELRKVPHFVDKLEEALEAAASST